MERDTCVRVGTEEDAFGDDPLDEGDFYAIRGEAAIAGIMVGLDNARSRRLRSRTVRPRTSAERHVAEFGHELAHGCCRSAA